MHFEVNKSIEIGDKNFDVPKINRALVKNLEKSMPGYEVKINKISGSSSNFWEYGDLDAIIKIEKKNQKVIFNIAGENRLGKLSLIMVIIMFLTPGGAWWCKLIGCWFLLNIIKYFLSRQLPEKYINEAIDSIKVKLENLPDEFFPEPETQENKINLETKK